MKINREARQTAKTLFRLCVVDGHVHEDNVRRVVSSVAETKPRNYLAVLEHFKKLIALQLAKRQAVVESATPLDPGTQGSLLAGLQAKYGQVSASFSLNPALLGGVRVRVGSDVWDNTVAGRLAALKNTL